MIHGFLKVLISCLGKTTGALYLACLLLCLPVYHNPEYFVVKILASCSVPFLRLFSHRTFLTFPPTFLVSHAKASFCIVLSSVFFAFPHQPRLLLIPFSRLPQPFSALLAFTQRNPCKKIRCRGLASVGEILRDLRNTLFPQQAGGWHFTGGNN